MRKGEGEGEGRGAIIGFNNFSDIIRTLIDVRQYTNPNEYKEVLIGLFVGEAETTGRAKKLKARMFKKLT